MTTTARITTPDLTARILAHAAGYMETLGPAYRCLFATAGAGIGLHLEDYGPIRDDAQLDQDADNRRRTGRCCLLGAINLAAQDYGFSYDRIDRELIPAAIMPLLNQSPEPRHTPDNPDEPVNPNVLWYDLLHRMSDITIERNGADSAHTVLADWLRAAARQAAAG